ncbi:phage holin [Sporosarcina sp. ITBMC105]
MRINWRIRLQSRAFWVALFALVGFVLGEFGVWDAGKYNTFVDLLLFVLVAAGVIIDPTTDGINDSERALGYKRLGGGQYD